MILGEVIQTVTTESCLDQIDDMGGFDEYIIYTSPAKLMSDLGCRLKQEMLYTLNDEEKLYENLQVYMLYKAFCKILLSTKNKRVNKSFFHEGFF